MGLLSGIGAAIGIASGVKGLLGGGSSSKGTAADPSTYLNIKIPGFEYPENMTGSLVDMPVYENLPKYNQPYSLPSPTMQEATIGEQGARKSTNQSLALLQAMLDPSSPISKNLVDAERQSNRASFLQSLNDVVKANRRQRSLGRQGFINPERMDEGITGSLMRNAYSADLQAKQTGRDLLSQLSGDMRSTASAYGQVAGMETGRRDDYMRDLLNYIGQKREDYTTGLGMERQDIKDVTDQNRQDIINALNLYKGNQAQIQPARQDYLAGKAGTQATQFQGASDLVKALQNAISGGSFAF